MNKSLLRSAAEGFFIVLMIFCFNSKLFAQWSTDPATNLKVCDVTGDQALPKIASTSDGGCYISWFDNRNGSYAVYLQRLDAMGNKLWATDGLLVSNNPQNSSLVDYSIGSDNHNNAIVTFTDIRDNDSLHTFAYLIDTTGTFLWGANGIGLSGVGDFQANPVTVQTSDGNYVFAWIVATDTQKIGLQKISVSGQKMWGTSPVIYASGTDENYTDPEIVASDNGSIVMIHQGYTGPFFAAVVHLYAQKFDTNGNILWGSGGVSIQNLGTIPFYDVPEVISDGNNGAFVAWYDDRDNNSLFSSFAQHVTSSGTITFPANGSEVSTSSSTHHLDPTLAYSPSTNELFEFWMEETPLQDQYAVYGQKFDASGTRQWSSTGMSFMSMSPNAMFGPYAESNDTSVYVFYLEGNASGINDNVKGFMVNSSGSFTWNPNIVLMSNPTAQKLHSVTTISDDHIAKIAWEDTRNDGGGIYAQNINTDGTLGNTVTPVELTSFSAASNGSNVNLRWSTATETNNKGFEVERKNKKINSNWDAVAFIGGKGTTTDKHDYSYTDKNVDDGTYNYRLVQVDFDGMQKTVGNVDVTVSNLPDNYTLLQNYPNPFNPTTTISYQIPKESFVSLKVYDVIGNEVADLVEKDLPAGTYKVNFNAQNLSSGVYFYQIKANNFSAVKKLILMK
jgi:Secretion system C-terminal sorting domain